jgi:two-component system nitrate/nitrite response regulator NarL
MTTGAQGKISVVIVDDHPLFREGVAHTLASSPDFDVVGQGETAEQAQRLACELLPDLLMLDINIPGGGIKAAQGITDACPVIKIVMLTVSEAEEDVLAAFKAGARAYVLKGVPARELMEILRTVQRGDPYVTPTLAASLLVDMSRAAARPAASQPPAPTHPLDELSEREQQILELVAGGASNKEIGLELHLSEKTIKHHMTNILQKLQVRNRVEAALLAQARR